MERKKERKAMLFTASFVVLSLITFSIALIIINNYHKSQVQFYEIGSIDRLNDLSSSIEQGLLEIFEVSSGLTISVNKNTATISIAEELPSSSAETFRDNMAGFQDFIESKFPETKLNLIDVKEYLPLVIYPYNVTFTHPLRYGQDRINIIPQQINFNSYSIYVYSPSQEVIRIDWGGPQKGDKFMSVTAKDYLGNSFYKENNKIDFNSNVDIHVILWNAALRIEQELLIKIQPNELGLLRIENHATNIVLVNTTVDFNNQEQLISIGFPKDTIKLNYTSLGISKSSTVQIE